jgi:hypothetical protein
MNEMQIIEVSLLLFWAGYVGLNGWLLRAPANDGSQAAARGPAAAMGKLQGEDYA